MEPFWCQWQLLFPSQSSTYPVGSSDIDLHSVSWRLCQPGCCSEIWNNANNSKNNSNNSMKTRRVCTFRWGLVCFTWFGCTAAPAWNLAVESYFVMRKENIVKDDSFYEISAHFSSLPLFFSRARFSVCSCPSAARKEIATIQTGSHHLVLICVEPANLCFVCNACKHGELVEGLDNTSK